MKLKYNVFLTVVAIMAENNAKILNYKFYYVFCKNGLNYG